MKLSLQDNIKSNQGAWIFVSHSHHDLEKVREIRNYLEQRGHNPLLFFLKCLNDDDARLPELIRDEIKERNWFVLCDSPNAKASKYIPEEVALVETFDGKSKETIDLTQNIQPQLYKLERLLKRATVFLSYSRRDKDVAEQIQRALLRHDYCVWFDKEEVASMDAWDVRNRTALDEAATQGFVLVLLSAHSLSSPYCQAEVEAALQIAGRSQRSNVIPVVITPSIMELLHSQLFNIQCFDLTSGPFDDRIEELIRNLKTREME